MMNIELDRTLQIRAKLHTTGEEVQEDFAIYKLSGSDCQVLIYDAKAVKAKVMATVPMNHIVDYLSDRYQDIHFTWGKVA